MAKPADIVIIVKALKDKIQTAKAHKPSLNCSLSLSAHKTLAASTVVTEALGCDTPTGWAPRLLPDPHSMYSKGMFRSEKMNSHIDIWCHVCMSEGKSNDLLGTAYMHTPQINMQHNASISKDKALIITADVTVIPTGLRE